MTMSIYDILALIGALAWLPQLIVFINNLLKKPKIELLPYTSIELGYTSYGPIINLSIGFVSDKKDAIIDKIIINLTHENNEQHIFHWSWLQEILMEIIGPNGEVIPYRKNQQEAVGLKVTTDNVIEKKVGFQIPEIRKSGNEKYLNLIDMKNNYIKSKQNPELIRATNEYNDFMQDVINCFIWKKGNYTIDMEVKIKNYNNTFKKTINFALKHSDVENLRNNIDFLKQLIENRLIGDGEYKDRWDWINVDKIN
jgi:hypothetical protein